MRGIKNKEVQEQISEKHQKEQREEKKKSC